MGKKYIIELLDDCPSEFKGIIVFGLTPEGQISAEPIPVEDLTPYTAPDLEQVRKEAYQQGYEQGYKDGYNEPGKEQRQEEQITKGDIVLIKSTPIEILVTYADVEHVSGIALTEVDALCEIGDQYTNIWISNVKKTGKHYDIASVLENMRGEQDG